MRFVESGLQGLFVVELEPHLDDRGSFARAFCAEEFSSRGLENHIEQVNLSTSVLAGTVRGLHYQRSPASETKLIRCIRGAVYDVAVDMRAGSESFGHWFGIEVSEAEGNALLVPRGFAHGLQTLVDDTTVLYQVSVAHEPDHEGGVHHADPSLGIAWPLPVTSISERDQSLPLIADAELP